MQVGDGVVVAGGAEAHPAVVGHDRHADADALGQGYEGEVGNHLAASGVQRVLRPGHVRGDGGDGALGELAGHRAGCSEPERQQRRCGETGERRELLRRLGLVGLLELLHLLAHRREPFDRVSDPDRQLGDHRRHLVAGRPVSGSSDRHRHERTHHGVIGILGSGRQQVAEGAGDHGHDDIVDRPAERPLDRFDVGELGVRRRPASMGADGALDRQRRARHQLVTDRPQPIERVAQLGGGSSRRARERTHGPELLGRVGDQLTQRLGDEHGVARFGRRRPCVRCGWWGVAARIEEAGDQIGAGHPVDHAMVHLRDERPLASSEAFDHPRLPQRPMPVELLRHQPPHQGVEIRFRAAAVAGRNGGGGTRG